MTAIILNINTESLAEAATKAETTALGHTLHATPPASAVISPMQRAATHFLTTTKLFVSHLDTQDGKDAHQQALALTASPPVIKHQDTVNATRYRPLQPHTVGI